MTSRYQLYQYQFFVLKVRVKVDHIPAHFQVSQAYRLIFISLPCGHFLFPDGSMCSPNAHASAPPASGLRDPV